MKVVVWLVLCLVWGTTWIFIKIGLNDLPPMAFSAARFSLAVAILAVIIKAGRVPMPRTASEWRLIALTGFLQFAVNYSCVFWSEQYISSGLAAVLQSMITVFGLALAWIFLPDERITKLKVFAVFVGIVGVAVIFFDQLRLESFWAFAGCAAVVIGSYCAAQASILIKARGGGFHPASLVFGQMSVSLPFIIGYSLIVEGSPLKYRWTATAVICIAYLTIFGTIAAFWLYYWLLRRIESTNAMMISLVTPLIAVVIGGIVLGERLPPQTLAGGVLIMASIALIIFRPRTSPLQETA